EEMNLGGNRAINQNREHAGRPAELYRGPDARPSAPAIQNRRAVQQAISARSDGRAGSGQLDGLFAFQSAEEKGFGRSPAAVRGQAGYGAVDRRGGAGQ